MYYLGKLSLIKCTEGMIILISVELTSPNFVNLLDT